MDIVTVFACQKKCKQYVKDQKQNPNSYNS